MSHTPVRWLLALALAACDADAPESAPTVASEAKPARFAVGDALRYRFDWRVDSNSNAGGILPDGVPIEAGLRLAGELMMRVYPPTDEGTVLGITIVRLDEHEITMMGQNALPDPADLLDREAFAVVGADGEVTGVHFRDDAPAILRHIVPGLLAQADLRLPARAGASMRVPAGSGVGEVEYAWSAPDRIGRTLRGYSRFDAFAIDSPADADGRLEITLDERGLPVRMDGGEEVWARAGDREEQFHSRSTFTLERVSIEQVDVASAPALSDLRRVDPYAPPDDTEAQRVLAQRFADGLEQVDVELAVYAASSGLRPSPELIVRSTGRLRGWPETAADLEPLFNQFQQPDARSLVIDMLASAGTPEAQTLMCRLLGDPRVRELHEYAAWLQRFTFLWRPQPGTARFLLDEHELARGSSDSRARRALLYPMGTVAGRISGVDPVSAAALRVRLREDLDAATAPDLRIAALGGLGNAGAPEDLEVVLAHERDADPGVRAAVASALRYHAASAATEALLRLLADDDHLVATSALSVLDHRRTSVDDSVRLAAVALGGVFIPDLAGRLTNALLRRRDDDPWVRAALVAMRTRARDPRERIRIDAMLNEG